MFISGVRLADDDEVAFDDVLLQNKDIFILKNYYFLHFLLS